MSASMVIKGGLGNVLFQLSFLYAYCKKYDLKPVVYTRYIQHKTKDVYLQRFWSVIKKVVTNPPNLKKIDEHPKKPSVYIEYPKYNNVLFEGYFQSSKFFEDYSDEIKQLVLGDTSQYSQLINKYPQINNSYFLHVRGGDYINHPIHELQGIRQYYNKCLDILKSDNVVVFTNDIKYAKSMDFYNDTITIIQEPELESLYLMSQCKEGVCANSSFSWWGAWLGRDSRQILVPTPWFNLSSQLQFNDIYYDGLTIVSTI